MQPIDRWKAFSATLLAMSLCAFAPATRAGGTSGLGLVIRAEASAQELGMPLYPGATPRKDKEGDQSALTLAAWGGDKAFTLAVMKLTSAASIDDVARFYRDALSRYGDVLDCSAAAPVASRRARDDVLSCDANEVRRDALILKVGLPRRQHLVKVKDQGGSVQIDLVRIDAGE